MYIYIVDGYIAVINTRPQNWKSQGIFGKFNQPIDDSAPTSLFPLTAERTFTEQIDDHNKTAAIDVSIKVEGQHITFKFAPEATADKSSSNQVKWLSTIEADAIRPSDSEWMKAKAVLLERDAQLGTRFFKALESKLSKSLSKPK